MGLKVKQLLCLKLSRFVLLLVVVSAKCRFDGLMGSQRWCVNLGVGCNFCDSFGWKNT